MSLRRFGIIGYAGVFILTLGILLQFVVVQNVMKIYLKRKTALKEGWFMRDIWSKLPFVIETHVYVFNVTNPVEVSNGGKPIIQEIGPFVYDTYEEKTRQIDHEEDDTVSYVLQNLYYYNPEKSKGLSVDMEVYCPHTYIMTASTGVLREKGPLASFMSRSVDTVLDNPESLFYKTAVKTFLFDGFPISCAGVEEFFGKLTCNLLRENFSDFTVTKRGDTFYTSIFGFTNGSYEKQSRIRIKRGLKNQKDLGKVVEIDGMSNLSTWRDDKCDAFGGGTDSTIFPPNLKKTKDVTVIQPMLCRRLKLTYDSKVEFAGLKLLRYTIDVGTDGDHVAEEKCYCIEPHRCLKKGMFDLFRCQNVPIIVSNPHFYLADPYYFTRVDTLHPDKEKHLSYVDFDALSGTPVRAHMRIQLNMELVKIESFRLMRNYSYAMLPMVWRDQIIVLPDFLIDQIKFGHRLLKIARSLGCVLLISGMAMCALAGYLRYKSRKVTELESKPTTPVDNEIIGSDGDDSSKDEVRPSTVSSRVD